MIPCGDKLLIKPDPISEVTSGGIVKPQTTFLELVSGTVEKIHNGYYAQTGTWVECQFKPGDKVYYQQGQAVEAEVVPGLVLVMEAAIVMREERKEDKFLTKEQMEAVLDKKGADLVGRKGVAEVSG